MLDRLTVDDEIELTQVSEEDAGTLFSLVDANRAHLRQWLPWLDTNTQKRARRGSPR